jgi:hypothetical protein
MIFRRNAKLALRIGRVALAMISSTVLLTACTSTVLDSSNVSQADPEPWAEAWASLPVDVHGSVPGYSQTELSMLFPSYSNQELASLDNWVPAVGKQRIVLYVNPITLPKLSGLCSQSDMFRPGRQKGRLAEIDAVLCDGTSVISTSTGLALSLDQSRSGIVKSFSAIEDELLYVLYPPVPVSN